MQGPSLVCLLMPCLGAARAASDARGNAAGGRHVLKSTGMRKIAFLDDCEDAMPGQGAGRAANIAGASGQDSEEKPQLDPRHCNQERRLPLPVRGPAASRRKCSSESYIPRKQQPGRPPHPVTWYPTALCYPLIQGVPGTGGPSEVWN